MFGTRKKKGSTFLKRAKFFQIQMAVFMFRRSEIKNLNAIQLRLEEVLKISKSSILRSVFSVGSLKKEKVQFFGKRLRFSKFKWLCSCSHVQK